MTKKDVFDVARDAVADGFLDEQEVEIILAAARERSEEQPLTTKERAEIMSIVRDSMKGLAFSKIPVPLRVLSILLMVTGALGIVSGVVTLLSLFDSNILVEALEKVTATTAGVVAIAAACSFASTVLSFFVGLRLMRGKRGAASALINVNIALTVVSLVCELMLYGIDLVLLFNFVQLAAQIALSTYLNPSLVNESNLQSGLRKLDTEIHAKQGTLGLADPGEGYIRLDFFNLFWTFIVGCVVGLIVEIIFHMVVVEPGVYQDRAGLLWGPFSPIYGVGAVLMTIALNRFKDRNIVFIFVVCTIIGGGFEYFVSWFMEVAFGIVAWDYTGTFPNINGRTNFMFMCIWGVLGLLWVRFATPWLLNLINKIPWNWRYVVTGVCTVLMVVDCVLTLAAFDCGYTRSAGTLDYENPTAIEAFCNKDFDNEFMENRFQSMTMNTDSASRAD